MTKKRFNTARQLFELSLIVSAAAFAECIPVCFSLIAIAAALEGLSCIR